MIKAKNFAKKIILRKERVLCVGLSKTGTTTFMEASQILGYKHKSMGFDHNYINSIMLPIYITAFRYESFDDYPWFFLYRFFDRNFPKTKFILTTRSSTENWYKSISNHERTRGGTHQFYRTYGLSSPCKYKDHYCSFYEAHNSRVREYFKGDPRFIEMCWENGDAWDKLCNFLGKPIPRVEFPHANKGTK